MTMQDAINETLQKDRQAAGDGAATGELEPGTAAHTDAGGAYPSVDDAPENVTAGTYFNSPSHMLKELKQHLLNTHGLAPDKEMFTKIHDYLTYHLGKGGAIDPDEHEFVK